MDIENLYLKATQATDSGNHDYAIEILQQILMFRPDHPKARRKLHSAASKRAQMLRFTKTTAMTRGGISLLLAHIHKMTKKYEKAVAAIEKYLLYDPSNLKAILMLADCCTMANYSESAIDTYEYVLEIDPKNPHALKALGNIYTEMKEIKKALQCFETLVKVAPQDAEASKKLRDLSALDIMDKQYTTADYRASMKSEREAEALATSEKILRSADDVDKALQYAIEELERNPEEVRTMLKVSDLYRRKGMYKEAREILNKAITLNPADPTIRMKKGDLEIHKMENDIRAIEKSIKDGTASPDAQSRIEKLKSEKTQFMLVEYQKRVEEHPTDLNFRFILGGLFFESGDYDRSISEFQQSRRDPQYRAQSLTMLGRAFLKQGINDLALKQFQEGLKGIEVMDDRRKELLYYLGETHIAMGNQQEALTAYSEIFEVDIRFKDVADKIKELRAALKK